MNIRRRSLLGAPLLAAACARKTARPNILFVLADDQSWPHASAYGFSAVKTPAFDRIAREGTLFTRAYTACPSCTPSRSAILTGRPIWQLGEAGVLYGTMPPSLALYPHRLADAGYHVGFTGKGWAPGDWQAAGATRHPCCREYNALKLDPAPRPGLDVRDMAANFGAFLRDRPAGAPFCFWLGSTEPHRVYEPGSGQRLGKRLEQARVPAFLPDTPEVRSDLLDYYAEVEWFDTQLGRALEVLEKTGELDQTMVIVTSDNGMPFPRAKANLYEAGIHMPLAIRWGKPGQVLDEFVSHIDLAPTILEAAGLTPPPEMRGRSLLKLLDGHREPARDQLYVGFERHTICRPDFLGYPMRAIRAERYLYIRNFEPTRWPSGGDFLSSNKTTHGDIDAAPSKDAVLASPLRGLTAGLRPPEELYDVVADPDQLKNLIADPSYQNIVEKLRGRLSAYLRTTGDPRAAGQDPWREYAYRQTTGYGASFNTALPEAVRREARERPTHKPE